MTLAWHFAGTQMRDGTPLGAPGAVETYDGPLVMCESGLHASERLLDALQYAPGPLLRRVRLGGEILRDPDKLVAQRREILWECDMTPALRLFARRSALSVRHLWLSPMPDVVREFLMTGREDARAAAGDAARGASRAAAWDADRDSAAEAAWAAAWGADGEAAGDAATYAAWAAASDAAGDAATYAAWEAAREAARDAQEIRLVAYAQAARAGLFHG